MSTLKPVFVRENGQDAEKCLNWSFIKRLENEDVTGVTTEMQTVTKSTEDKETQTSNPLIMHIDLSRTHSKLKHASLVETDGLLSQFDRQAPARISTSPTLRRMRSTRRPQGEFRDPLRMDCTEEEPDTEETSSPFSPFHPVYRYKSPLAATPPVDEENQHENRHNFFLGQGKGSSYKSNTFDNGITCTIHSSLGTQPVRSVSKDFECPDDSNDQDDGACQNRLQERRRSSVVVSLPGMDVSPGDLFVSNRAVDILNFSNYSNTKKSKWPFSRRSTTKGKTTRTASDIEKYLLTEQIQDWRDTDFQKYKDCTLEDFLRDCDMSQLRSERDPQDYKRQEAVWELFTSECVYFLDQLMVLKEVFLGTLTNLQMSGCLSDLDSWRLFANLNELCLVSFGFLTSLLRVIKESWEIPVPESVAGPTLLELLTTAFRNSICHCLQKYCLNYSTALFYLDSLKHREDFGSYVKWCERNQECRRLQLRDLLVAPLQRLTRYPLLLKNLGKRIQTEEEESALQSVVEQVDAAICDLEGNVKWLDNYQKVKQLRDALVWLPVWERDKRAYVPENLKHLLKAVTLENLIAHRSLLHEGKLVLTENAKLRDVYLFLFDEFLLITKIKRTKKKSTGPGETSLRPPQNQQLDQLLKEGVTFTVLDQPVSLDRVQLKNIDQLNAAASGLPQSFIIMHQNRYQQCIAAFILQAPSEAVKRVWISEIEGAVASLLRLDSQQPPRVKSSSLWLESSQI
ncbi:pleckstrin homology domain-containing family G member 7 [Esox lucius]|uniref:Pleckstrin homology domain containing, family G (with RhoGef domain) member 7 n=1 Tax=Esox lucius TaxID=8010 RepID=A0A3P8ZAJ7_ESOLU|nr:pleckstrin homology domain-containing family G member 7 [Esox lucius]XP_010888611.2 pleckstrin homology domain-containing family G member 7 [Esox lucius]